MSHVEARGMNLSERTPGYPRLPDEVGTIFRAHELSLVRIIADWFLTGLPVVKIHAHASDLLHRLGYWREGDTR